MNKLRTMTRIWSGHAYVSSPAPSAQNCLKEVRVPDHADEEFGAGVIYFENQGSTMHIYLTYNMNRLIHRIDPFINWITRQIDGSIPGTTNTTLLIHGIIQKPNHQ